MALFEIISTLLEISIYIFSVSAYGSRSCPSRFIRRATTPPSNDGGSMWPPAAKLNIRGRLPYFFFIYYFLFAFFFCGGESCRVSDPIGTPFYYWLPGDKEQPDRRALLEPKLVDPWANRQSPPPRANAPTPVDTNIPRFEPSNRHRACMLSRFLQKSRQRLRLLWVWVLRCGALIQEGKWT